MSMLSAKCYELHKCADALQDAIDNLNSGRITYDGLTDALHYGINDLRSAANTIWELRNKMGDMVDAREEAERLREERDEWHRVAVSKQDIIDHMRDARAENAKLRERITELEELLPDSGRWFSAETVEAYVADNAKLRERITELEELLPDSGRWFSAETVEAYVADNAKLLKIVSCLLTCASDAGDCDRCPLNGGTGDWNSEDFCDDLLDCLRELRFEVTS